MLRLQFRFRPEPIQARLRAMRAAISNTSTGPVRDGYDKAADRYVAYIRRRYRQYSSHGGTWVPLSPVTLQKRREEGFKGKRILYRSGGLFNNLKLGGALLMQRLAKGFRITFGRSKYGKRGWFHNKGGKFGKARVPARPILVAPDAPTRATMKRAIEQGYRNAVRLVAGRR